MMKLNASQIQKQILAPALQQSIAILLRSIADLKLSIETELQSNPLLEIDEAKKTQDEQLIHEALKHQSEKKIFSTENYAKDQESEEPFFSLKAEEKLEENLLKQLRIDISDPLELQIGELIIGNINEDGYLTVTLEEIAELLKIPDPSKIELVLEIIQSFEPAGIASRNLTECLLLQAREKFSNDPLIQNIISSHLTELGQKKYRYLARVLKTSLENVKQAAMKIACLDPKPARNHRPLNANIYITPDVYIYPQNDEDYTIHINNEDIPRLRINPYYQKLLKDKNIKNEERQFIREKIKNALVFIKGIEQRGHTVRAIANYILNTQKEFFREGTLSLLPMTLGDVAKAIGRNESTISRAIHDKYIQTPHGLFPMKFFFSTGINHQSQEGKNAVASRSIKEEIKELIAGEDACNPLADQQIERHFAQKGLTLARRTISKYRKLLKIPPSHLRKKQP